jgi:hypothetical protein
MMWTYNRNNNSDDYEGGRVRSMFLRNPKHHQMMQEHRRCSFLTAYRKEGVVLTVGPFPENVLVKILENSKRMRRIHEGTVFIITRVRLKDTSEGNHEEDTGRV